ncbi:hypothetical protein M8J77_024212 [Diaphorina citri]|nr:hypothetical protein M8J77_024212 [Diaphorina citri]
MALSSLKKERTVLRSSLTKASSKVQSILSKERLDDGDKETLYSNMELMNLRYDELGTKDAAIRQLLAEDDGVDDATLVDEQEKVDFYTTLYLQVKKQVGRLNDEDLPNDGSIQTNHGTSSVVEHAGATKVKLPVLKLKEFNGELKEWLPFWAQFKKVHENPEMADVDKLGYLSMAMVKGSVACSLVESFPATGEMYPEVIKALKVRFGRPDLLTELYIRQLLTIILQNVNSSRLPLSELYDTLQCHLRNLEILNVNTDNCGSILMPLVSSCLPPDLLQVWERSRNSTVDTQTSKDSIQSLMDFLRAEVESEQRLTMAKEGFGIAVQSNQKGNKDYKEYRKPSPSKKSIPTASGLINMSPKISCLFCRGEHKPQDCKAKMTLQERRKCVNESHGCYCCLRPGHRASYCRNRPKCKLCGKGHFAIMCSSTSNSDSSRNLSLASSASSTVHSNVLMQTLMVKIHGNDGKSKNARALIDTGSQRSYMLADTAVDMHYVSKGTESIQHALFGGNVSEVADYNVYNLNISQLDNSNLCNFDVLGLGKICSTVNTIPQGPWIQELAKHKVQLSDIGRNSTEIEILIGSDVAAKLWTGNNVPLRSGLVAMKTILGWTLSGRLPKGDKKSSESKATLVTTLLLKEAQVTDLWSLDVLGITDPTEKMCRAEIELATYNHFLETVKVRDDNRFEVDLPWIKDHPPLSDNYELSKKRLESTIKKLKGISLFCEYQSIFDSWEKNGIIERVPKGEMHKSAHYLPHHHVLKTGSTTPVRPVFDASAKEKGGVSLNECLEKGPNLIEKIPSCLARFRQGKIGISGDIEKAFLQISLSDKDRDFLRFLWIDEDGKPLVYRHCRVVFGVSPSPFLLESSIKLHLENTLKLAKENKSPYPLSFVEILGESFYVDNCLTSLHSFEQAKDFIDIASSIMKEGMFTLRGWELTGESSEKPTNVLGLLWNKEEDTLCVNVDNLLSMDLSKITKRVILSAAHRIFDPIGIVSSFTIVPKLLLQELWETGLTWDDEVAEDTRMRFNQWMAEVPLVSEIKVPRWVSGANVPDDKWSLHIFSDASKAAYAAAVFLRVEHESEVTVQLLAARSRVAPTSKTKAGMTIPRLELLAASIATRLYKTVAEDFKLFDVKTVFWTDATTVLAWIRKNEPWNTFVMNRVKEIRLLSKGCQWQHVPGELNPADLPSRGSSMKKLIQSRWWEGPQWLKEDIEHWPRQEEQVNDLEVNAERKKTVVSAMLQTSNETEGEWSQWYRYFSQFTKLVKMVAWVIRFVRNCKSKKEERSLRDLTAEEITIAENKIFTLIQRETFKDMSRLKHLVTFETDGLIRIQTKVSNRDDSTDFCNPIVLPGEHPVVRRLIMSTHKDNCHAGGQILLSILRKRFWILRGRQTIRSVINTCVTCKRQIAKRIEVVPTPLPEARVRDAKVFEVTGVDFAGPLYIKADNGSVKKAWVCLFTCAVYRAVRLELVTTLSTDGFMQALRRFSSRQGRPSIIYSDNGTNMVGFDNACAEIDWEKVATYSSVKRIDWRFNPPSSPWWGGWWERMMGLVKNLLRRILGRTSVDYEELSTILSECEAVINSRPLTYVSDNSSDLSCISPSMFLHDLEEVGIPEFGVIKSTHLSKKLKRSQELKSQLCKRFRLEYLGQLQLFANNKKKHELRLGEIVLVGDDNNKRINWPLGLIIQLIQGGDGHIRVVKVRTSTGVLTRPVQRIYPLEFQCSSDDLTPLLEESNTSVTPEIDTTLVPIIDSVPDLSDVMSPPRHSIMTPPVSPRVTRVSDRRSDLENVLLPQNHVTRHGRNVRKPTKLDL